MGKKDIPREDDIGDVLQNSSFQLPLVPWIPLFHAGRLERCRRLYTCSRHCSFVECRDCERARLTTEMGEGYFKVFPCWLVRYM
jgi:hypothetical protein